MADQSHRLQLDIDIASEVLRSNFAAFNGFQERARLAYVGFVNFAPSVSSLMQEVDKWHHQFEYRRL